VLNEGIKEAHEVANNYKDDWLKELQHRCELEAELSERPLPKADPEQPEEQGTFVRTRRVKRATPETYRIVFDLDVNGQRVLEHLTMVFCKDAFVPDDKGGERQTSYNLGAQGVINFIVNNINTANNPNYEEQDND
ncbi:Bbp19 family protein, partial [Acinetobacter soli]|uniref:Bbp19 family protein n=1 Tax=Acinetobacter soli TaxID=487316 RepID=UPI00148F0124